ncbi:hypothetical protein ACFS3C_25090 [Azotobacter vinelandii]
MCQFTGRATKQVATGCPAATTLFNQLKILEIFQQPGEQVFVMVRPDAETARQVTPQPLLQERRIYRPSHFPELPFGPGIFGKVKKNRVFLKRASYPAAPKLAHYDQVHRTDMNIQLEVEKKAMENGHTCVNCRNRPSRS